MDAVLARSASDSGTFARASATVEVIVIRLEVIAGESKGTILETEADLVHLGRADTSELCLRDHTISGTHASTVFNGRSYVLRDHHSTNGTRVVRDSEVHELSEQPGRELSLLSGDMIELGEASKSARIRVHVDEEFDDSGFVSVKPLVELQQAGQGASRELLQQLYAAQKSIAASTELGEVLDAVAAHTFAFLPRATHVTVALREIDEDGQSKKSSRYVPVGTRVSDGGGAGDIIPVTRSVFRKVVKDRAAVLAADAKIEVGETASLMAAQILSTIGIPLWQGDAIIGVLQVDNRASKGIFKEGDLDVLGLLAQSASQAFARARLFGRLRVAEERQRTENLFLKRREERRRTGGIIGESKAMHSLFEQLRKVVDTRVTVLIEGETGTGKELAASAVHYWSVRKERLFVAQNCAAMPESLLESELFGHRKGSFTGATDDKKGLFELADGGTLFLDEVGEMGLPLQAKLLRVLQEGEIRPVGASRTRRVDTRIVAATNRDLEKEVREGRFREDLYYRLKVFPISIPPLRKRGGDIALLAEFFLKRYTREFARHVQGFSQEAMERMLGYAWPGNVRELENEVQRLVIQVEDKGFVQPEHLSDRVKKASPSPIQTGGIRGTLKQMVEEYEKAVLAEALEAHGNNKTATAKTLSITREGLHKKLKGYGMA